MREIIPIGTREQRMPEAGRIRLGVYTGKRPKSIDTFRFTSSDAEAIHQLAAAYGGTAEPWSRGHGSQWEVITDANEVRIVLPPDPLHQAYELWSGGGCQRRCDGDTVETPGNDGMVTGPCICRRKDQMECSPKTRLNVILPDIKFGGVWRLETSSWNALDELKGFTSMIQQLQQQNGLTVGLLALEQRQSKSNGQTKNYVVPTLRLDTSVQDVLSGASSVSRLAGPQQDRPMIEAPAQPPPTEEPVIPPEEGEASGEGDRRTSLIRAAQAKFRDLGWDYETQVRPALDSAYSRTLSKLTVDEMRSLLRALDDDESRLRFEEHMPYIAEEAS